MFSLFDAGHIGKCLACFGLVAACCSAPAQITQSRVTTNSPSTASPAVSGVTDPGVRGGAPGAGGTFSPIDNTSTAGNQADQDFFLEAKLVFQEVVSVSGTTADSTGGGLGPTFNHDSCATCHSQPAIGGSSPATNPQGGE